MVYRSLGIFGAIAKSTEGTGHRRLRREILDDRSWILDWNVLVYRSLRGLGTIAKGTEGTGHSRLRVARLSLIVVSA